MPREPKSYDAIIVGAGFAGLYQLFRARGSGLKVRLLEAAEGIGGTWFWNRYPGARCDVESLDYSYSFSEELQMEWDWTELYAPQAEILRYINYVADRFNLRPDIQLNTRVAAAVFDDTTNRWTVTTDAGEVFDAKFVIMATGGLSVPQRPSLKGLENFRGRWLHSARWPDEGVDFTDQRVGLIGTGSSGVQMVPIIAEQAAQLAVFQRTANFSVPAQNGRFEPGMLEAAKAHYSERRAVARETPGGVSLVTNPRSALELTETERQSEMEYRWRGAGGGFRMLRAFTDILTDPRSNKYIADFARAKIRQTVRDPRTAELLCPRDDVPFGAKRLCVDTGYYESFNRDNVSLVDVAFSPIIEATEHGLRTAERDYKFDMIVFATGFDALTGALLAIDIRGSGGGSLRKKWAHGPKAYLGLAISGFPNLFTIAGPGSPSVLSNVVHSIETHVDWITSLLNKAHTNAVTRIEARLDAESEWVAHCNEVASKTLLPRANSWYMGANIDGKPRVFMPYAGGVPAYRRIIENVVAKDYEGFRLT
jgi:cyclohexanone monooxygenase